MIDIILVIVSILFLISLSINIILYKRYESFLQFFKKTIDILYKEGEIYYSDIKKYDSIIKLYDAYNKFMKR